jgi:signal peptidase II
MISRNPGAAFGQLDAFPWFLVLGRAAAALFLVWLIVRTPRTRPWFGAALVLVLGGALGNLYDNLFLDAPDDAHPFGLVRDFIDVYFGAFDWHFPTFNVADSCITVGAVLLLLSSFRSEKKDVSAPRTDG